MSKYTDLFVDRHSSYAPGTAVCHRVHPTVHVTAAYVLRSCSWREARYVGLLLNQSFFNGIFPDGRFAVPRIDRVRRSVIVLYTTSMKN
jgi:hypothetical protein